MTKATTTERYVAILWARGVPEAFVEAIATRRTATARILISLGLMLVVVLGGIAAIIFDIFDGEPVLRQVTAAVHAGARQSFLYLGAGGSTTAVILMLLLVLKIGLSAAGFTVALGSGGRAWPAYNPQASLLRSLRPGETLATLKLNPNLQALAGLPDEAAFLQAIRPPPPTAGSLLGMFGSLIVIFAIVLSPMIIQSFAYTTVTLDQVVVHSIGSTKTYRLADARYAYVLCYDKGRDGFDYRVAFADGTIGLWTWRDEVHDLGPREVLSRLATIDARLSALGVPVHHMPADQGHACVTEMARRTGADPHTLRWLVYGN